MFDFSIDMDNLYPSVWFGDAPGKRVCLRLCSPEEIENMREECTATKKEAVVNPLSRKMEFADSSSFDEGKFKQLLEQHSIVDWDLTDVKGQAIPCTDENKNKLMGFLPFAKFINECLKELAEQIGTQKEEELKNFESSQGG